MGLITIADHIHDIAENSINAGAKNVVVTVKETEDTFYFSVEDDAGGIKPEILDRIFDPFVTTRKKEIRRVGLGLPFLKQATELTGGYTRITTKLGIGTKTEALFYKSNIDCQPVGNLVDTFLVLILNIHINWKIKRCLMQDCYTIDSESIKNYFGELDSPMKITILKEFLDELEKSLYSK
ncbi:MAG: ATP-binding protein [Fervidobacterium sp.]|nr:ATP-binding protein [Fervidobacterium sp.]